NESKLKEQREQIDERILDVWPIQESE
mgnify:CR=1